MFVNTIELGASLDAPLFFSQNQFTIFNQQSINYVASITIENAHAILLTITRGNQSLF